jgi:hypothetical protein
MICPHVSAAASPTACRASTHHSLSLLVLLFSSCITLFIVAIASDNPNDGGPCPRQAARHHRRARRLLFVLAGLMLFASLVGLTSVAALLPLGGLNILYRVWCGASTRGSDVSGSWWRWPAIGRRRCELAMAGHRRPQEGQILPALRRRTRTYGTCTGHCGRRVTVALEYYRPAL